MEEVRSVPAACVPSWFLFFTAALPLTPGIPLPSASGAKQRGGDRNATVASGLLRACSRFTLAPVTPAAPRTISQLQFIKSRF